MKILELQEKERRGVCISHLQSIGPKLGLNFVWNDCIMGSLERLEFDWNGKQFPDSQKIHHGWLDYEELLGRKGTGFGVMADIGGETQTKPNSASQEEEKGSVSRREYCKVQTEEKWLLIAPFVVDVTSYWYRIGWSQGLCSRRACLCLTDTNRFMPFPAAGHPAFA